MAQSEPRSSEAIIVEARSASKGEPGKAEKLYKEVLARPVGSSEVASRDFENALIGLGELYRDYKKQQELAELIKTSRSSLSSFAKAKTAKLSASESEGRREILLTILQYDNC